MPAGMQVAPLASLTWPSGPRFTYSTDASTGRTLLHGAAAAAKKRRVDPPDVRLTSRKSPRVTTLSTVQLLVAPGNVEQPATPSPASAATSAAQIPERPDVRSGMGSSSLACAGHSTRPLRRASSLVWAGRRAHLIDSAAA